MAISFVSFVVMFVSVEDIVDDFLKNVNSRNIKKMDLDKKTYHGSQWVGNYCGFKIDAHGSTTKIQSWKTIDGNRLYLAWIQAMASVGEANVMDEVGGKISSCEVSGKRVDNESGIEHIMCTINQRFGAKGVFQKPQQMIYTDSNNKLVIDDTVLSQIGLIDAPLNIVAICGHYRTGKSYLMNVLAEQSCGFALGCTSEGKTKGIWVWCRPHPKQQDQVLILLDTEGQSDIDKGDLEHDNKLFCLTTLLSSTLIYNHKGALDNYILDKLSYPLKMSNVLISSK